MEDWWSFFVEIFFKNYLEVLKKGRGKWAPSRTNDLDMVNRYRSESMICDLHPYAVM